ATAATSAAQAEVHVCAVAAEAARSQPDRDVVQQAEGVSAQSRRADGAQPPPSHRLLRASPQSPRMRKLLRACPICLQMIGIRFRLFFCSFRKIKLNHVSL